MTDENKNIENNQEENQNKSECNKSWWKNCWGITLPKGFKKKLLYIFTAVIIILHCLIFQYNKIKFDDYNISKFKDNYIEYIFSTLSIINRDINLYFEDREHLKSFKNIVFYKYKRIFTNSGYHNPIGIKLNDNEIFIYEEPRLYAEIYNNNTKKFKTIKNIGYNLGHLYYKNKEGKILFIHNNYIIEFDNNLKTFKKISEGIPELEIELSPQFKEFSLFETSEDFIYIGIFNKEGQIFGDVHCYYKFDSIIKLDLKNYKYEKIKVKNSPIILNWVKINSEELLLISEQYLYIYNLAENKFEKKYKHKLPPFYFYICKSNNTKIFLIPYLNNISFRILDIKDFSISDSHVALNSITYSSPICIEELLIFPSGIIWDSEYNILYYPNKFSKIHNSTYNKLFLAINNKEFLRLGFTGGNPEFVTRTGSVISIKEFTNK